MRASAKHKGFLCRVAFPKMATIYYSVRAAFAVLARAIEVGILARTRRFFYLRRFDLA